MGKNNMSNTGKHKSVSYAKWGYIFIAPFFLVYLFWSLYPQILTFYYSFFEYYEDGLDVVGPNFVGFKNFATIFGTKIKEFDGTETIAIVKYTGNTVIMWIMGAVPQFAVALLLAVWFTNMRLNIKGQQFFKTVMYMPNLIMASAFSMLFWMLFAKTGPINQLIFGDNMEEAFRFMDFPFSLRSLVALMNFLMWFGNTMIVLMAGIMGIDQSLFEAAAIDGASSTKIFFKVTLPLLMPIITYSVITALIGGINMFDVPQLLTNDKGTGAVNVEARTLVMYLNNSFKASKNYGMGGAISVLIFLLAAILSIIVYRSLASQYKDKIPGESRKRKGGRK